MGPCFAAAIITRPITARMIDRTMPIRRSFDVRVAVTSIRQDPSSCCLMRRERDFCERRAVEFGEKRRFGRPDACLEPTAAVDRAGAAAGAQALDQRLPGF